MKYKVGDRVKIKSLDWYNENKDDNGNININGLFSFNGVNKHLCGTIMTIRETFGKSYMVKENDAFWTDEMIEGLAKEGTIDLTSIVMQTVEEKTIQNALTYGYDLPKGCIFKDENGNVINATKIVLEEETDKVMNENNTKVDMGEVSDGYHTFNELYEDRMLYNAALFNEFAKQELYDVHKSRKHSDGEYPFGDSNWFIVMAELPTGQISNHYEKRDWDKFQIPEKPLANEWDGHSPRDVADRLTIFTNPKKEYPKTYEECCEILKISPYYKLRYHTYEFGYGEFITNTHPLYLLQNKLNTFGKLLIYRDAYWKIAGDEMGLGKPWEPDWNNISDKYCLYFVSGDVWSKECQTRQCTFAFPTPKMRDSFKENFYKDLEFCKELL